MLFFGPSARVSSVRTCGRLLLTILFTAILLALLYLLQFGHRSAAAPLSHVQPQLPERPGGSQLASISLTPTTPSFRAELLSSVGTTAIGDVDGDGALDVIVGKTIYWNNGRGIFTRTTTLPGEGEVTLGDFNSDGALDVYLGEAIYWNDGIGGFAQSTLISGTHEVAHTALGDLDGNGTLDIVLRNVIYWNDHGSFVYTTTLPFSSLASFWSVAVGDLDNDGALDVVLGGYTYVVVFWNDGEGGFSIESSTKWWENRNNWIVLADLNGDQLLDITLGQYYGFPVYLNNGDRTFTYPGVIFGAHTSKVVAVAIGDLNGDGTMDVVNSTFEHSGIPNLIRWNSGGAVFTSTEETPLLGLNQASNIALGDLNGDSALDVVIGYQANLATVFWNDGNGGFAATNAAPFEEWRLHQSVSMADLNRDDLLDVIADGVVYWNDGLGGLTSTHSTRYADESSSISLGDLDSDGDLDIVNLVSSSTIFWNDGWGGFTQSISTPVGDVGARSLAIGDMNGDGVLDIVQSYKDAPSAILWNNGRGEFTHTLPTSFGAIGATATAVGDLDNDGAPDIVQGGGGQPSVVHWNDGQGRFAGAAATYFGGPYATTSIALGDLNADGFVDIVQGNYGQPSFVYLNNRQRGFSQVIDLGSSDYTNIVVLGDLNGDGTLDIVRGNGDYDLLRLNVIHWNEGNSTFRTSTFAEGCRTLAIGLGDLNSDGMLDIAQVNDRFGSTVACLSTVLNNTKAIANGLPNNPPTVAVIGPQLLANANFVYSNPNLRTPSIPITYTVFDPEGDPVRSVRAFYSPDGGGRWYPAAATTDTITVNLHTTGGALQFDGVDDYVEIPDSPILNITDSLTLEAWVNLSNPNADQKIVGKSPMGFGYVLGVLNGSLYPEVWDADGGWHSFQAGSIPPNRWTHLAVTWQTGGDMIGYINGVPVMTVTTGSAEIGVSANVLRIGCAPWSGSHAAAGLLDDVRIYDRALSGLEIRKTMARAPVGNESGLVASWGLDEGFGSVTRDRTVNHYDGMLINGPIWISGHVPAPTSHVFVWDVFASGFFGQSDNAVFRIEAYPSLTTGPNGVPVFQHPYASATTFPFRVRGTQVRVLSGTTPVSNAIVYDLPVNQTASAEPFTNGIGDPFRTDGQGYLRGRGRIDMGDRLLALLPITATDAYTLYHTSAAPTVTGLDMYTVTRAGVQTLTVSSANPLLLFNLDVSLEWDARGDAQFLSRLRYDLARTSELLYDWTNGQAALGRINVYHAQQAWLDADVRIYATNRMRPNAAQGGLVSAVITDPVTSTVTYEPGQVRISAIWNRYGDPGGVLGEDWPRTLAHELGHYALFLDDDYLGLDVNGLLVPVDTCTGTAMSDPYRDDFSELHHGGPSWTTDCANTLAAKVTGRWDWATVKTFYPWLNDTITNTGPSGLPLAVTQIMFIEPITPSTTLPAPIFYLSQNAGHVVPGAGARAFVFQHDRLIDLGRPTLDQVVARGARPGDRLCVFDLADRRSGCETIAPGDDQLALISQPDWDPEVVITPITSRTIEITVTSLPSDLSLGARLYSADGISSPAITFTAAGGQYASLFNLEEPSLEGYIHVWVDEDESESRREVVTDFSIGGNPGRMKAHWGRMKAHWVPGTSSDGQVVLFGKNLHFDEGELIAFQAATVLPSVPVWATVVGRGYRLTASAGAPDLSGASVSFYYAGGDVPPGEENWLRIYFWNGATWRQLPTRLDVDDNFASAPAQGPGLYALMSSVEIPLYGPGWDLFAYPVQATPLVGQALTSIDRYYEIVYWYDGSDLADPWKVYAPGLGLIAPWVNDLSTLRFGEAYWISLTQSITLYLNGGSASASDGALSFQSPPATFYGPVSPGLGFTPTTGMPVTAWIDGKLCGQGKTQQVNGVIVYSINVLADGPGGAQGCGALGRVVSFKVGMQLMWAGHQWNNDQVWSLPLKREYRVYLPLSRSN